MLDTNIVSAFVHDPGGLVGRRILRMGDQVVAISIVVAAEVRFGVERKGSDRLRRQVDGALESMAILPLEAGVDRHYGELRAALERRGQPIGANDLLIAAHALSLGATLVTDNVREFERVEGLGIENWLRDG